MRLVEYGRVIEVEMIKPPGKIILSRFLTEESFECAMAKYKHGENFIVGLLYGECICRLMSGKGLGTDADADFVWSYENLLKSFQKHAEKGRL